MGMKHSGKSTLGQRLATRLAVEFLDLDEMVEQLYDPARRFTCREIYRERGREHFAELEGRAARELALRMERARGERTAITAALGGGTIENQPAMNALKESALRVYLREAEDILFERIMQNGLPAFLSADDPRAGFDSLYARRTELFERWADVVVDLDGSGLDEAFSRLCARLGA